ncbi:hypothetical protein LSAT2_018778 [Lamellibrachia satsuma]|nr:hypothetical protein LSAT2_018778 [Lamellibrachia satsuma]
MYRKRALEIIGGIWTLSALVATPTFVDYSVHLEPITSTDVSNTTAKLTGQSSSAEAASGFVLIQLTLAVFSTSYNIVIYLIYNAEFRKSFLNIFCCVRPSTVHPSLPLGLPVTPAPPTVN